MLHYVHSLVKRLTLWQFLNINISQGSVAKHLRLVKALVTL